KARRAALPARGARAATADRAGRRPTCAGTNTHKRRKAPLRRRSAHRPAKRSSCPALPRDFRVGHIPNNWMGEPMAVVPVLSVCGAVIRAEYAESASPPRERLKERRQLAVHIMEGGPMRFE